MSLWVSKGIAAFVPFIRIALISLLFGASLLACNTNQAHPTSIELAVPRSNAIARENALQGTRDWQIPGGKGATTQIQAYASATSVSPGQKLIFYVSTQTEGLGYSISIYRLGWYGGLGGRLMLMQANRIGHTQGYYDESTSLLLKCSSCRDDKQTGLIEADWQPSFVLTVPRDWTTGVYLAKFVDVNGMQTYTPFDVLGNVTATYVVVTPDTTNEAYNDWGGYSLYRAKNDLGPRSLGRGLKVSFDRPYLANNGSAFVLTFEIDAIRWFERQGYDLSYISSIDLHEDPAQLLSYRAYLSLGHDESWTKEMRDGVEHARDMGVGLAFLGANASYWQIRFEPDSAKVPDRTIVCYKVETANHDLTHDPFYGKDNTRVTSKWRDPVLNRPENALIGIMYSNLSDSDKRPGVPWQLSSPAQSPLLNGTDLRAGQQYGCDLVGYEWDRIFNNGFTPVHLQVLGRSNTVSEYYSADFSNTTYYIAPSGALVFATGSIYWTISLDSYRLSTDKLCADQDPVVPGLQKLMINVMNALVVDHPFKSIANH